MSLTFTGTGSVTFTNSYEILTPIDVSRETLDIAHRADNNTWNTGKKVNVTLSDNVIITIKLALRIHRSLYDALESFLQNNYNTQITATATGYDLFDDNNRGSSNNCRIIGFDQAEREQTNWYKINIRLVKI